ncbi:hypothetical protein NHH03_13455 [Stieleria sp. TO1_6]|uniref:3-deoxy-D-manno-octulosonic acid transferase n=1 Tax=Stieleria tagensis TaxID=2956795 RepID=UPI00209AA0A5|nr:hypothetical protein [Stieleria tagensis]MCO8122748.1 hypothetical protein [Stieleria tagensis]
MPIRSRSVPKSLGRVHSATVGGSFGDRGGQNMLEPAGYGGAISFGPNTRNFADITRRLLDAHCAVRGQDEDQLQTFVQRCLTDVPAADALGRSAKSVVEQHRGATDRTVTAIANLIGFSASAQRQAA